MSNRTAEVRAATHDDILSIRDVLEFGRRIAERELPEIEYPWFLQYMLDLMAQRLVFVAVIGSDVVGVVAADFGHWPWNRQFRLLNVMQFFVQPGFRRGATAAKLLDAVKDRAKELDIPLQLCVTYPDGAAEYKDRFVQMQGFEYTGGMFWCK